MMDKSPCYGCGSRSMGCHAGCAAYKDWRAALDASKPNCRRDEMKEYAYARGARLNRLRRSGTARGKSSLFRNFRRVI